jgi:hypothetical protein
MRKSILILIIASLVSACKKEAVEPYLNEAKPADQEVHI